MTQKIFLITLLCFSFSISYAQKKRKKKSEVQIIEFTEDSEPKRRKRDLEETKIIIKTNPLSNVMGWQFVEGEYKINSFISVQAGVGLTFKSVFKNLYTDLLYSEISDYQPQTSELWSSEFDVYDNYSDQSIRKYSQGLYGAFSSRFYFYDEAIDGSYISIKGRFSSKNIKVQSIDEGSFTFDRLKDDYIKESLYNYDFMVGFGYQELFDNMSLESFFAVGYRITSGSRQDLGKDSHGAYHNGIRDISDTKFRLELGWRLGFQL